jgi:hypothetical protein
VWGPPGQPEGTAQIRQSKAFCLAMACDTIFCASVNHWPGPPHSMANGAVSLKTQNGFWDNVGGRAAHVSMIQNRTFQIIKFLYHVSKYTEVWRVEMPLVTELVVP